MQDIKSHGDIQLEVSLPKLTTTYLQNLLSLPRLLKICQGGFPGGAVVENLPANAGDAGLSPGLGRSHMPRSN